MTHRPRSFFPLPALFLLLAGCSASPTESPSHNPSPTKILAPLLSHVPQAVACLHEQAGQDHFKGSCQGLTTHLHALTTQALQSQAFQTPLNRQIQPGTVAWSTTLGTAAGNELAGAHVKVALTLQEGQTATACTITHHRLSLVSTVAFTALGCKTHQ